MCGPGAASRQVVTYEFPFLLSTSASPTTPYGAYQYCNFTLLNPAQLTLRIDWITTALNPARGQWVPNAPRCNWNAPSAGQNCIDGFSVYDGTSGADLALGAYFGEFPAFGVTSPPAIVTNNASILFYFQSGAAGGGTPWAPFPGVTVAVGPADASPTPSPTVSATASHSPAPGGVNICAGHTGVVMNYTLEVGRALQLRTAAPGGAYAANENCQLRLLNPSRTPLRVDWAQMNLGSANGQPPVFYIYDERGYSRDGSPPLLMVVGNPRAPPPPATLMTYANASLLFWFTTGATVDGTSAGVSVIVEPAVFIASASPSHSPAAAAAAAAGVEPGQVVGMVVGGVVALVVVPILCLLYFCGARGGLGARVRCHQSALHPHPSHPAPPPSLSLAFLAGGPKGILAAILRPSAFRNRMVKSASGRRMVAADRASTPASVMSPLAKVGGLSGRGQVFLPGTAVNATV